MERTGRDVSEGIREKENRQYQFPSTLRTLNSPLSPSASDRLKRLLSVFCVPAAVILRAACVSGPLPLPPHPSPSACHARNS